MSSDIETMLKEKQKRLFEIKESDVMDKEKIIRDIEKDIKKLKKQLGIS